MGKTKSFFLILFIFFTVVCLFLVSSINTCPAQGGWPAYTPNVLTDPIIQYIQAASFPGSIMVSGCWGYPWLSIPGDYSSPTTGWSTKKWYMYYPPIGWFDSEIYPFWHIYNVADPFRDFPNFPAMMDNPGTWLEIPRSQWLTCTDPICYYLAGGVHFFSGAVTAPYMALQGNNPSLDPMLLRYLSLMGLFGYDIPPHLASLPL